MDWNVPVADAFEPGGNTLHSARLVGNKCFRYSYIVKQTTAATEHHVT